MNYEIKVFSELNSELKAYWQNLEAKSNGYCFQSYDWVENWMNNLNYLYSPSSTHGQAA